MARLLSSARTPLYNRKVGVFGDSIPSQNSGSSSSNVSFNSKGFLVQANALLKQRFSFAHADNFGVAGEKTSDMILRLSTVISSGIGGCFVIGGTNDLGLAATQTADEIFATVTANLTTIYDTLQAAGIVCYALPILPRVAWGALTSPQIATAYAVLQRVNTWIRGQQEVRPPEWFQVIAVDEAMLNAGNANFAAIANTTSDNLHPIGYGAYLLGKAISDHLSALVPPRPRRSVSRADAISADNPLGDIAVNGSMYGTAGSPSTGASGSVPAGWTIIRTTGSQLAATCTKETDSLTSKETWAIELSSGVGAATEVMSISQTINAGASTFAAGDQLVAEFEFDNVDLTNIMYIACEAQEIDGSTTIDYFALATSGNTADREPSDCSRLFVTPEFTVRPYSGSGTARIILYLQIYAKCDSGTVGGSIKIKNIHLRKVP